MEKTMMLEARDLDGLLAEASSKLQEDQRNNFRAICLNSDLTMAEVTDAFSDRFTLSPQGEFHELKTTYQKYGLDIDVHLYLYEHPEIDVFIIFTLNSSGDFSRTAESIIQGTEGMYYLWMPPNIVEALKEDLLAMEGSRLNYFYGKKFSSQRRFEEERRPEYPRKDEYEGNDAADTLEERKKEYGITPTRLRFDIPPKGTILFSNLGDFVLLNGAPHEFYHEIVQTALGRVREMNEAVQSSELSLVEEKGVERVTKKTLEIEVELGLDYEDAEDFFEELKEDEFFPYNLSKSKGSLLLDGRIVDQQNGGMFSLSTDGQTFSILPKYGSDFDSLMRFYRFVVEKIDSDATINLDGL